jgi:hypothetical protein
LPQALPPLPNIPTIPVIPAAWIPPAAIGGGAIFLLLLFLFRPKGNRGKSRDGTPAAVGARVSNDGVFGQGLSVKWR